MGIARFFNQFIRKIPFESGVLPVNLPSNVSSASFDLNSPLHEIAHIIFGYGETELMKEVNPNKYDQIIRRKEVVKKMSRNALLQEYFTAIRDWLIKTVESVSPQELIVIAVDGPAPAAKISQQRQRRYLAATSTDAETSSKKAFDPIEISPGTELMIQLDAFLREFLDEQKNVGVRQKSLYNPKLMPWPQKVIYSSHLVPGEGEHKIMDLIRAGKTYNSNTNAAHVIYGGDADLILLAGLAPLENMMIMRQDQDTSVIEYVNINKFKDHINKELKSETAIDDFVIMTFCLGNDFLPHPPSMGQVAQVIDRLIETYVALGKNHNLITVNPQTKLKTINWDTLKLFFINFAKDEKMLLSNVAQNDKFARNLPIFINSLKINTYTNPSTRQKKQSIQFNYSQGRDDWYTNAVGIRLSDRDYDITTRLLKSNPFEVITDSVLFMMIIHYFVTFSWVYQYYIGGMNNVDIFYVYPYYYSPLFSNIARVCKRIDASDIEVYIDQLSPRSLEPESINVIYQQLAIIPPKKANYLPKEVHKIIASESNTIDEPVLTDLSPVSDMFPIEVVTDKSGSRYKDGGIVLVPFVNFLRLHDAINSFDVLFTQKRSTLYLQQDTTSYAEDRARLLKIEEQRNFAQLEQQLTAQERRAQPGGDTFGRGRKQITLEGDETRVSFGPVPQRKIIIVRQGRDDVFESSSLGRGRGRGGKDEIGKIKAPIPPWKTTAVLGL